MDDDDQIEEDIRNRLPRYTKNFSDGYSSTHMSTIHAGNSDSGMHHQHQQSGFAFNSDFKMKGDLIQRDSMQVSAQYQADKFKSELLQVGQVAESGNKSVFVPNTHGGTDIIVKNHSISSYNMFGGNSKTEETHQDTLNHIPTQKKGMKRIFQT